MEACSPCEAPRLTLNSRGTRGEESRDEAPGTAWALDRGQQLIIDLIHALQALADGRQHLLLQQGDFLFSIGPLDLGAAHWQPFSHQQDPLDRKACPLEDHKWILLRTAELRGRKGISEGRFDERHDPLR